MRRRRSLLASTSPASCEPRHNSLATLLLGRGINPKIVSEMLGHASIEITLGLYSHVLPHMYATTGGGCDG